ncbi:hypothetical protein T484DRAFT_1797372 [Baffinella frigidus]|nr:hypothetical protein T484DRAFT_1797372 [Cryptophyta sp. CCMP2293]
MLPRGRSASRLPLLSLAVLLVSLLLAGHVGAVDENVMDTDGDGQVSTEEFIEHAQCQLRKHGLCVVSEQAGCGRSTVGGAGGLGERLA